MTHPDPLALLTEIAQTAMNRMNTGDDISSWEAWTLGRITALAARYPGVLEGIKDAETVEGAQLPPRV